jgi:Protein of unknown function (DUF4038)/Domain of unknown function (DUF5060)/Putative collagen-binding domain of a collagenase
MVYCVPSPDLPATRTLSAAIALSAFLCVSSLPAHDAAAEDVPRWGHFEATFTSAARYANPVQENELRVTFRSPSNETRIVRGFWDGGAIWRVRFSPDEIGEWTFVTAASTASDSGLHARTGRLRVTAARGSTPFDRHGPIRVAPDHRSLQHADGTPFFWLADTAWNGVLLSTPDEWRHYLRERVRQRFTAVQWVATQFRASPDGDRQKALAFSGRDQIAIDPAFFRRLDEKLTALNQAGLLGVPVLLWAIGGGSNPAINPGYSLPEEQAILLAQYMVARWQAHDVAWILPGDGDYRGEKAEKWKRIGRAVFGDGSHAPVLLHPGGMHWVLQEFRHEPWLDIHGYQSGHGDDDKTLAWMTEGPPARDWTVTPHRPFINLEPPYEHHLAYQSRTPISPHTVRRAVYWSLLNAPTAGVSYGGHGVWGWDDGTKLPTDHPNTGMPLPWKQALTMPGAEQMAHVAAFFTSVEFWRLRPAPDVLAEQPGAQSPRRFIAAAAASAAAPGRYELVVLYTPEDRAIRVKTDMLPNGRASWLDPRTGTRTIARGVPDGAVTTFETPAEGDWVLVVTRA